MDCLSDNRSKLTDVGRIMLSKLGMNDDSVLNCSVDTVPRFKTCPKNCKILQSTISSSADVVGLVINLFGESELIVVPLEDCYARALVKCIRNRTVVRCDIL